VRVAVEKYPTFEKRISKNDIAPKDGSEPLTVIEFSLTNEIKESLKAAIDAYRDSPQDDDVLVEIIKKHFPPEILKELDKLAREEHTTATVYVVKNLPEISRGDIPNTFCRNKYREPMEWGEVNTYSSYIGYGIGLAIGLEHKEKFALTRFAGDRSQLIGHNLHKHNDPISMLGGVITNGAETRFTDMQTLLEETERQSEAAIPNVTIHSVANGDKSYAMNKLSEICPNWRKKCAIGMSPKGDKHAYEHLLKTHSQTVVIGSGDLALWAEDNRIFHQALPKENDAGLPTGALVRYMIGHGFDRPKLQL